MHALSGIIGVLAALRVAVDHRLESVGHHMDQEYNGNVILTAIIKEHTPMENVNAHPGEAENAVQVL
jgi:hypothetical protein